MTLEETLYEIADELRSIAENGLFFSKDPYDRDRYEKSLKLSARIIAAVESRPAREPVATFGNTLLHLSPLVGVSNIVPLDGKILLIQRTDNELWGAPGGLAEVGETPSEAALRELEEEAGITGRAVNLLAVFDSRLWASKSKNHLNHLAFRVEADDLSLRPGPEAISAGFFSQDRLPPLSPGQDRRPPMIFKMLRGEVDCPYFDGRIGP